MADTKSVLITTQCCSVPLSWEDNKSITMMFCMSSSYRVWQINNQFCSIFFFEFGLVPVPRMVLLQSVLQYVWLLYSCHYILSISLSFSSHSLCLLPGSFFLSLSSELKYNSCSTSVSRQEPCGICRPMNPWRWWSSTTACRPWPTRWSFPTQGGSTSPTRTRSRAMQSGPPSSRTPLAASGWFSLKISYKSVNRVLTWWKVKTKIIFHFFLTWRDMV